ncbi:MAG: class I SAM-dependent methyltransferase [Bacteroidales bacterium]|nr:class I SAM-dependent methyltransferase [Bacteroidales bacterium]
MEKDKRTVNIHDLGAGAVKAGKNIYSRKVSDMVRHSAIPEKYGLILAKMAQDFGRPYIIELGTSAGISALYMAASGIEVHTIEGCPETAGIARKNFRKAGASNITLHVGSFDDILPDLILKKHSPGLVFIDGNHRRLPLLKYFELVAASANSNSAVIIDDICLSREMNEAWKEIKKHPAVSVTIDLYKMGIVFFRKGFNTSHFIVRY